MLINFPYIKRDTPVHRLDARTKLILLFAYSFSVIQTSNFWFVLVGFILASFYYSQAHLKWRETRRPWTFILLLVSILIIGNYFLSAGGIVQGVDLSHPHILYKLPYIGLLSHPPYIGPAPLIISVESITFLITQAMRNISIAMFVIPLPYTTPPSDFGVAFRELGLPDKIAYAVDLAFRFLPSAVRDFSTTLDAQRARGYELDKLEGGLVGKTVRLAPMLVPVVIGSIIGAEDIISAMELRCFGVGKRTWYIELHPRQFDRIMMTLAIAVFIAITLLNILGYFYTSGPLHILHIQGIPKFLAP
jgi:energy-coupling factor transport system permease protein